MSDLTPDLAELRALAQRANNWGRWARWTDQDGASHMRGLFMVGNLAAVIPIGEMWVETDPDDVNPIAECYTPELADFIAAANPAAVLALLDAAEERDEIAGRLACLLCDPTGGLLSKTTYPVPVMVQEIEQYLSECHESDLKAERDALAAAVEHYAAQRQELRELLAHVAERLDAFTYDELAAIIGDEPLDQWGERYRAQIGAERDRLAAKVERVRALHVAYYPFQDGRSYCGTCEGDEFVPYPCPTIRAIDGTETDHA